MIIPIIIFGFLFTIGNIVWPYFDEPKVFYIPLSVFISLLVYEVKSSVGNRRLSIVMEYFFLLSLGNVVKQIFYSENIKQINDFLWGGILTARLFYKLIKK